MQIAHIKSTFLTQFRKDLIPLLIINTLIAVLLSLFDPRTGLLSNLIISHCIGFCISLLSCSVMGLLQGRASWSIRMLLALPLGLFLGFKLAAFLGAFDVLGHVFSTPQDGWRWVAIAIIVSSCACAFFVVLFHSQNYRTELEIERRRLAEAQQAEIAAQLAMLQAQIEPHFLFNTLANLRSLITHDPHLAQLMLDHLDDYLRATLLRTRKARSTLAEEIALVSDLLCINQMRLGQRLTFTLNIPEHLMSAILPPLLLQPLVENALKHGIEPAIVGGNIDISAEQVGAQIKIKVSDTGLGLQVNAREPGIGLANVRARLASLYEQNAALSLSPLQPHGVVAELSFPFERTSCQAH